MKKNTMKKISVIALSALSLALVGGGAAAITSTNVSANTDVATSIEAYGAPQIRVLSAEEGSHTGIRFGAKINNYNEAYSYGMIVAPVALFEAYETTINENFGGDIKAAAQAGGIELVDLACLPQYGDFDEDGVDEYYIQGSLVKIKAENMNADFAGVGYYNDGEKTVYDTTWADNATSVGYVASEMIHEFEADSALYNACLDFANGAVAVVDDSATFAVTGTESVSLYMGETAEMNVTQAPAMDFFVKYVSDNEDVATVSADGTITAVSAGTANITAYCVDKTVECAVNVNPVLFKMANEADADNVYLPQWAWVFATAFDDTVKFNNGNGSLKVTWTTMGSDTSVAWLSFKNPAITDISAYDYVTFDVYNPTTKTGSIVLQGADNSTAKVTSQGVTTFRYSIADLFNGTAQYKDTANSLAIDKTNVSGFTFKFWKYDYNNQSSSESFALGESVWVSPIRLEKAGATIDSTVTVDENTVLFAAFAQKNWVEHCTVNSTAFIRTSASSIAYSTDYAYGNEAGSLKITPSSNESAAVIYNPMIRNISGYKYLVYRIYNPNSVDVKAGFWWCGDTVCKAGEWTEVKLDLTTSPNLTNYNGTKMSLSNIEQVAVRIMDAKGLSVYVSNVYVTNE